MEFMPSKIDQVLKTVQSLERAFDSHDRRLARIENRISNIEGNYTTKSDLNAFVTKSDLNAFVTKSDLKSLEDRLVSKIDGIAKSVKDRDEEWTIIKMKVESHEGDISQIKKKVGIK